MAYTGLRASIGVGSSEGDRHVEVFPGPTVAQQRCTMMASRTAKMGGNYAPVDVASQQHAVIAYH